MGAESRSLNGERKISQKEEYCNKNKKLDLTEDKLEQQGQGRSINGKAVCLVAFIGGGGMRGGGGQVCSAGE